MPNYCDYEMKVIGSKKNCEEFLERLRNYDKPNHFWRIFEADAYDEIGTESNYTMYICGYCAWSIESCCRASGYSEGVDLLAVNTKELGLILEIWTQEVGMKFQEHYIYNKGRCEVDQEQSIDVYYWNRDEYEIYEEYKEEYPDAPAEEEFDDEDEIILNGFENYGTWDI